MIRRLMEYRASWVRIPARMAGMPHCVWNRPVTKPASIPARKAHSNASPSVQTCPDQHDGHGAAGGQRAVHRQISYIQNTEGDVDADGHQAPDQALGHSARQRIEKGG